jgi:hypothetical protein
VFSTVESCAGWRPAVWRATSTRTATVSTVYVSVSAGPACDRVDAGRPVVPSTRELFTVAPAVMFG